MTKFADSQVMPCEKLAFDFSSDYNYSATVSVKVKNSKITLKKIEEVFQKIEKSF
jgi:hypothetical protein